MQKEIVFETRKGEIVDITDKVAEIVKESKVRCGLVNIFAPHATGVLLLGENEPNIASDYLKLMKSLAPEEGEWEHNRIDNNAHAHLRSVLFGSSICVPISDGKLLLGTWQRIMFVENDRSRIRRVIITVVTC